LILWHLCLLMYHGLLPSRVFVLVVLGWFVFTICCQYTHTCCHAKLTGEFKPMRGCIFWPTVVIIPHILVSMPHWAGQYIEPVHLCQEQSQCMRAGHTFGLPLPVLSSSPICLAITINILVYTTHSVMAYHTYHILVLVRAFTVHTTRRFLTLVTLATFLCPSCGYMYFHITLPQLVGHFLLHTIQTWHFSLHTLNPRQSLPRTTSVLL